MLVPPPSLYSLSPSPVTPLPLRVLRVRRSFSGRNCFYFPPPRFPDLACLVGRVILFFGSQLSSPKIFRGHPFASSVKSSAGSDQRLGFVRTLLFFAFFPITFFSYTSPFLGGFPRHVLTSWDGAVPLRSFHNPLSPYFFSSVATRRIVGPHRRSAASCISSFLFRWNGFSAVQEKT